MSDATDRILDAVMVRIQGGVTTDFANQELLNTAEAFFARSFAWLHTQKVTIRADRTQTVIPLPQLECRILQLFYVGTNSQQMRIVPFTVEGQDYPSAFAFTQPNILKSRAGRTEDLTVSVVAFLTARALDAFPNDLLERYFEGLTDGLLARLYAIPQRPWTSAPLARVHMMLERRAISDAYRTVFRGFGGPQWQFPQY